MVQSRNRRSLSFVNLDELSESTVQKGKQFVEVELGEQRSLTNEGDD
jgi:hypothetical protein